MAKVSTPARVRIASAIVLGAAVLAAILTQGSHAVVTLEAQSNCNTAANPIVCENLKPGDPASQWDISGAGDMSIQGFATNISVTIGQTQGFKIDTPSSSYGIDIYRMGYYGGAGARKVASISPSASLPQNQPNCLSNSSTGLVDCGNWGLSASWTVPVDAVSGIYFAKLNRFDTGGSSHVFFIVRESDTATHKSEIVFQTADTTWQAYNQFGGNSLYVGSPAGRAYKVSYNRPFTTRSSSPEDWVFNAEYPMVRFLESNGYDVSYISGVDSDRFGATILTPSKHKIYLSVGHDEYWSGAQRTNVEAARAAGMHLAFFSGNEVFWKTRWENSIDGSNTPYRTLVCYKETHAGAVIDPQDPPTWTGTWRDARFSPPADGGRPENALTGQLFMVNAGFDAAMTIPAALGKMRFWRNTSVATLATGATATLPNNTLGYEWDADVDNGFRPNGFIALSQTTRTISGPGVLLDNGSSFGSGTVTHRMSLYRHPSGALVFGAGTVQWSWGLDSIHDRGSAAADVRMKQATVNLFADMGVQPGTLQTGLVAASASLDTVAPTSVITSPGSGASLTPGNSLTIAGTASEAGGGQLVGVEVSTDGGTTWNRAIGTTSWSYTWTVAGAGAVTLKSRGYDDSGNMETPSAGVTVNVTPSGTCPCTLWGNTTPPAPLDDNDAVSIELGMRFQSEIAGFVTAVRFYKGTANTGTHTGSLWTNTGTLLGTVTFTNETASGWQQMNFPSPIAIAANTSYVVSYHAPVGHYTGTDPYFLSAGFDKPPLHALRSVAGSGNGLYAVSAGTAFPTNTWNGENYWVDVVFNTDGSTPADTTPPAVVARTPASGATGVDPAAPVTATFSEAMTASTISTSTFELRNPSNALVTATVTYNAASNTATLTPAASLSLSTTYTATVKGGSTEPRVKDAAGNAMAANASWTFTTAAAPPPGPSCPCRIWANSVVPSPADDNDSNATNLGTRFRSDVAGYVTAARFYKAPANTGTHVATLWTNTGTQLGQVTFTGETASGWQEMAFPSPIPIAANTTYVISYLAPNGHYSGPDQYFQNAGVDSGPLHALRDGVDGPNGVSAYASTSVFPTFTWNSESYFVDVVFNTSVGPDVQPPVVQSVSPAAGSSGAANDVAPVVTFSEALNATTVTTSTVFLKNPSNVVVPATVTYNATARTATITPSSLLAYSTTYTGTVKGGTADPRIKDSAGNALASDYTWSFSTGAAPPPPPSQGSGGPILIITSGTNAFATYYAEILRNEGYSAFTTADLSTVSASTLANYDVAILGEMTLNSSQVSMFTTWVNGGGNLVAMRPDKQLASLLGLTDLGTTLSNAYLLVNTASGPGVGIVNQTMQFHGTADRYTLNGASAVATLYSNATTATSSPAVTMRTVGSGRAVAFTYDLARSVVYTRQGNPAWSGQERDGFLPMRSDDLFFGARSGDVQPDWIDLNKVQIPQADEQQRLLWNTILNINTSKRPLPRFWYFPRMLKAVVIMTGDDHGTNGTTTRFNSFLSSSTPGCVVADWECIRGTSYIYTYTPITNAQVQSYVNQGFEIGVHISTNCGDYTSATLSSFYADQIAEAGTNYPAMPAPKTNRTHCIVWSDYTSQAQVALNNGIRLDTNYYYWPGSWILNRPGMFTGSGMPMRFATSTGSMIDVYQAATQMTDESDQTMSLHINTLLDNAIGSAGYYGAFTANMHTDFMQESIDGSNTIIASAKARGVPVITARQMLEWLDGRNASAFQNLSWNGNVLSFNLSVGAGANGLRALVPATHGASPLTGITSNGSPVSYTLQTIKGVQYAVFTGAAGAYQVSYGQDVSAPIISGLTATAIGTTTATIAWTTNEPSDTVLHYGTVAATVDQTSSNAAMVTSHSVSLSGLTPNTTYYYRAESTDGSDNTALFPPTDPPASFVTAGPAISGNITPAASASGATVALSGTSSASTTANGSGTYSFNSLSLGNYTVTPSKAGYTFTPASRSVSLTAAGASGVDFTIQPVLITGTISGAGGNGATLSLSGAGSGSVTADASGNYTFSGIANGTYTVTPSKAGFTFSPPSQTVVVNGASVTGIGFTSQAVTVSGGITPAGDGSGAALTLGGPSTFNTTADGSGAFSFSGVPNGTYTLTALKTGFVFTPSSQSVTVSGASVSGLAFTAAVAPTYTLSGSITPAATSVGAVVTLSGASTATATVDASGNYSFGGLPAGAYTVTPAKTGFAFTPASRSVTISSTDATADFTMQAAAITIDATVTFGRSSNGGTIVSPAFSTTAPNQLLLAFIAAGNRSGTTTVTGVTGGGLTWQLVRRTNSQRGTSEIWRAYASSTLTNVRVTGSLSQSNAAQITVMSFRGVDTSGTNGSGAIGATASGSASSGAPTASLVTTRANSLVIGVGNDWDRAVARTVGADQVMVSQHLASNPGDTYWVQRRNSAAPAAGTTVVINDTAPTGDRYNLTICEILTP